MKDVEAHSEEDVKNGWDQHLFNENGETPNSRVRWAIKVNKQQITAVDALLEDTERSIEPVSSQSS